MISTTGELSQLQTWLLKVMQEQQKDTQQQIMRQHEGLRQYIQLSLEDTLLKLQPHSRGTTSLVSTAAPRSPISGHRVEKEGTSSSFEEAPLVPIELNMNETIATKPKDPVRTKNVLPQDGRPGPQGNSSSSTNGTVSCAECVVLAPTSEEPVKDGMNGNGKEGGEPEQTKGAEPRASFTKMINTVTTDLGKFRQASALVAKKTLSFEGDDEGKKKTIIDRLMGAPLDLLAGFCIFASTLVVFMQLQWRGYEIRVELGQEEPGGWQGADQVFIDLEYFFATVFFIELVIRVLYFKLHFLADKLNVLDAVVVVITTLDTFVFSQVTDVESGNLVFTRMIRYAKLVRTLRFVRAMKFCHPLRVLIRTIASSFMALFWSMLILVAFMLMSALFLCQTLQEFIADPTANMESRLWVEKNYGNAAKSLWTMTEITFSGGWPTWVRPLIEDVHVGYAVFFCFYVGGVVFAVIRIITALFLKDTLSVAANDSEMMVQQKMKEKARFAAKLEEVFNEADASGDGMISWSEFHDLLEKPSAKAYLASLELETHEVESMFTLLDDGDGAVSFEEFLAGVIRLKGTARSQDVLALLHDNRKVLHYLGQIHSAIYTGEGGSTRVPTTANSTANNGDGLLMASEDDKTGADMALAIADKSDQTTVREEEEKAKRLAAVASAGASS